VPCRAIWCCLPLSCTGCPRPLLPCGAGLCRAVPKPSITHGSHIDDPRFVLTLARLRYPRHHGASSHGDHGAYWPSVPTLDIAVGLGPPSRQAREVPDRQRRVRPHAGADRGPAQPGRLAGSARPSASTPAVENRVTYCIPSVLRSEARFVIEGRPRCQV
jgi:hypothetical protein